MTAKNKAVAGDKLSHELLGQMFAKFWEIVRRTREGTFNPWQVINALQDVVEGKFGDEIEVKKLRLFGPKKIVYVGGKSFFCRELMARATSAAILEELGGLERASVGRKNIDQLLETADKTKRYLCFIDGKVVIAYWSGDGWYVSASAVEGPIRWLDGYRVFSRN